MTNKDSILVKTNAQITDFRPQQGKTSLNSKLQLAAMDPAQVRELDDYMASLCLGHCETYATYVSSPLLRGGLTGAGQTTCTGGLFIKQPIKNFKKGYENPKSWPTK